MEGSSAFGPTAAFANKKILSSFLDQGGNPYAAGVEEICGGAGQRKSGAYALSETTNLSSRGPSGAVGVVGSSTGAHFGGGATPSAAGPAPTVIPLASGTLSTRLPSLERPRNPAVGAYVNFSETINFVHVAGGPAGGRGGGEQHQQIAVADPGFTAGVRMMRRTTEQKIPMLAVVPTAVLVNVGGPASSQGDFM